MDATCKQFRKRNAILACLRQSREHPSAERVYELLKQDSPDISLATVYRNLALFKKQGVVRSVGTVNGVERFDGDVSQHAHFICRVCGQVTDLADLSLPEALFASLKASGAQPERYSLCLTGLCRNCQNKGGEAE